MQIFYFSKKKILLYLSAILLILVGIVCGRCFLHSAQPTLNPIYIGDTKEKAVALMFNVDWGEEVIPEILTVLEEKEVKATFFITGRFAKKFPELVKTIAHAGHEIGNHGYSHPYPNKLNLEQNIQEIKRTEEVFNEIGIEITPLFAPPYGEHGPVVLQAAHQLAYKTIMWTLDTIDWQDPEPEVILERILPKADHGSLILMHPKGCTLRALPKLIDSLRKDDYSFKTVSAII